MLGVSYVSMIGMFNLRIEYKKGERVYLPPKQPSYHIDRHATHIISGVTPNNAVSKQLGEDQINKKFIQSIF